MINIIIICRLNQVTQGRNNKRKYSEFKSVSSNSSTTNDPTRPEANALFHANKTLSSFSSSKKNKGKERLHSKPPVIHQPSTDNVAYIGLDSGVQNLSLNLSVDLLDVPPPTNGSSLPFAPYKPTLAASTAKSTTTKSPNQISIDKNFSNTNYTSHSAALTNTSNDYIVTNSQMGLIASGGYYAPFKMDDYYEGQNPHQHLFSSSSFHAINHASILPSRNTDITANAFMEDINVLLGTGWNEFELQM